MADPTAPDSATSAAAEQSARTRARRPSPLSVQNDLHLERSGDGSIITIATEAHPNENVGDKRGRSNEVAIDDKSAATTNGDRNLPDNPCEGAVIPLRRCHSVIPPEVVYPRWLSNDTCCTVLAAGASKRLAGVELSFRQRAKEWLACGDGVFPQRDGPAIIDKITDQLLVVASDVATAVAATSAEKVSGRSRFRMLAWLVADARGSVEWGFDGGLDKVLAETVGRRLDRQAQRVRDELNAACAAAEADRLRAQVAGADDDALALIDDAERKAIMRARDEVYVGFTELEALLPQPAEAHVPPQPEAEEPEPEPTPVPTPAPPACASAPEDVNDTIFKLHEVLEAKGIRCPHELIDYREDDVACPPDLAAMLGSEAVQEMQDRVIRTLTIDRPSMWWEWVLPSYVKLLQGERALLKQQHAERDHAEAEQRAEHSTERMEQAKEIDELNGEIEELQSDLDRAKGREEALHEVIRRCRWG